MDFRTVRLSAQSEKMEVLRIELPPDVYTATDDGIIFESPESSKAIGKFSAGQQIQADGEPVKVDGFTMLPIKPKGAVQKKYMGPPRAIFSAGINSEAQHTPARGPAIRLWSVPAAPLETYVALTRINVREDCDVQSARTGRVIEKGEKIRVRGSEVVGTQRFFKLADRSGWVFQRGVAGEWLGTLPPPPPPLLPFTSISVHTRQTSH